MSAKNRVEAKMNDTVIAQVVEKLGHLPQNLQRKVLEFTNALTVSVQYGIPGQQLLRFAGVIPFDDLHLMEAVIEAGCEQVDLNEW